MLLWDFVNQYYLIDHPELARGTRQNLNATIRTLEKFLQRPAMLTDLDKRTLYAFMAWCADQNLSPKTINNKRGDLISLWYCAEDVHLLPAPPRIKKRIETEPSPVVWSMEEIRRLYSAADLIEGFYQGIPQRLIFKIAFSIIWDTGTRIGSLRQAGRDELNLSTGQWNVPAKHYKGKRKGMVYRLHPDTLALIRQLPTSRLMLVPLWRDKNILYKRLRLILTLAELPCDYLHKFHCIRRTAETHAAAKMGIAWAAKAVGHTEAVAKKYYINQSYLDSHALFEALPRL